MVTFSFGEAQAPFSNLIMEKQDYDNEYSVSVTLFADPAFTTWAESLDDESDPFHLHLAKTYSDYTLALSTDYVKV